MPQKIAAKLNNKIDKLKSYLNTDSNVVFALVFGSTVKGKPGKNSDVDLAIYFEHPLEGLELLAFICTLSDLTDKNVDVIVLNSASAFLRHQVIKYGVALMIKDKLTYTKFREKTITDYQEYIYVSGMEAYVR